MNIVNAHVHMIDPVGMAEKYGDVVMPSGVAVLADIKASFSLLRPEALLAQMDEAGIDKTILYAVEAPLVYASNEYVHALCTQLPDRLMGFASVNPKDDKAVDVLEHAVRNLGMLGLKLHPPLQDFFPNDESIFPIYEKCIDLNIPVVFHVGTTPFGVLTRLSQASPILIDDVAVEFPELRIMLTHLGTLSHNEAFMVVEGNPNVFIDTAAYVSEIEAILTPDLVARIGADKIIFGTDYPMPSPGKRLHRMKDFVDCVAGLDFPADVLEGFFHGNVETLLHGRKDSLPTVTLRDMLLELQHSASGANPPAQHETP